MKNDFLIPFENLPYFTLEGFKQYAGARFFNTTHSLIMLNRWVKRGLIIPLKRGMYMHHHFYGRHYQEPAFIPMVSAILTPLSYLSLEYVLQLHGILTEITYPITAVTIKNTRCISNTLGDFVYRHIKSNLYCGYKISDYFGISVAIATPAKALFDFFYFQPTSMYSAPIPFDLSEELRLNISDFTRAERNEFREYVNLSKKKKMARILDNLEITVWRP